MLLLSANSLKKLLRANTGDKQESITEFPSASQSARTRNPKSARCASLMRAYMTPTTW